MANKEELIQKIHQNPFYDWKEKELWLQHIEQLSDDQLDQVARHFDTLTDRADNIPSNNEQVQESLLEVIGRLHGKESIQKVIDIFSEQDQEFSDEEWTEYLAEVGQNPDKMLHFFATLGPDGLEFIAEAFFDAYMKKEIDITLEKFTKIMASITGLKQMIEKANREYVEELKTIYLQELERKQVEEESSLDRADELVNNFLNDY